MGLKVRASGNHEGTAQMKGKLFEPIKCPESLKNLGPRTARYEIKVNVRTLKKKSS